MDSESRTSRSRINDWNLWRPESGGQRKNPLVFVRRRPHDVLDRRTRLDCKNPDCPFRSPIRRFLRAHNAEGVMLQGRWYCSLDCFESAITALFADLIKLPDEPLARPHRIPIGLLLLGRGIINEQQLKNALQTQREQSGDRLGRLLVRLGIVSAQDVAIALACQWGCALFPLERDRRYRDCSQILPLALLESCRMVPLHYMPGSQWLFLGFCEDIDHTAIYSIERLLSSRIEPCVVSESALEAALEEIRGMTRPCEIVFERLWSATEMARTIRDYAVKLGADDLMLARPRQFLWARLRASGRSYDLMFRLPQAQIAAS
jgi:hypothetical protein